MECNLCSRPGYVTLRGRACLKTASKRPFAEDAHSSGAQ